MKFCWIFEDFVALFLNKGSFYEVFVSDNLKNGFRKIVQLFLCFILYLISKENFSGFFRSEMISSTWAQKVM